MQVAPFDAFERVVGALSGAKTLPSPCALRPILVEIKRPSKGELLEALILEKKENERREAPEKWKKFAKMVVESISDRSAFDFQRAVLLVEKYFREDLSCKSLGPVLNSITKDPLVTGRVASQSAQEKSVVPYSLSPLQKSILVTCFTMSPISSQEDDNSNSIQSGRKASVRELVKKVKEKYYLEDPTTTTLDIAAAVNRLLQRHLLKTNHPQALTLASVLPPSGVAAHAASLNVALDV